MMDAQIDTGASATPQPADQAAESPKLTPPAEAQGTTETGDEPSAALELKVPEGIKADEALLKDFTAKAQELGLSSEAAQQLVDLYARRVQEQSEASAEVFGKMVGEWEEHARSDKEFGGTNFDRNVGLAVKALDTFGTPELREELDRLGVGNHPELIRFCYRVGKALSEDTTAPSGSESAAPKSRAEILYGIG